MSDKVSGVVTSLVRILALVTMLAGAVGLLVCGLAAFRDPRIGRALFGCLVSGVVFTGGVISLGSMLGNK